MYIKDYCLYEINQEFAEQTYLYDFNGRDCFMNFSEQEFYYCLHQLSYQFDEFQNKNGKESHKCPNTIDEIKRKFHRSDGEGLLKNIKDKINLDLEIKETDSLRERFDKFRLLKLIYAAEKLGVYRGNLENENIYFMNKCSILNIISNPKNIYMYNNYDDSFLEEFEVIYDNVRNVVKNAEEIESTIDDLYNNWIIMIFILYLGIGISGVYKNKLSEIRKQKNAIEKIVFNQDHFISKQDYVKKDNSNIEKKNVSQTYSGVIEKFFIMLVTARKRAEINDQLFIKFNYKNQDDNYCNTMDKRVVDELLKNDFYKKEVLFEEFIKLLQYGSDEEKLYLWRVITSKYNASIPEKEFFMSRGEFSKVKKYMGNLIEQIFSLKNNRKTISQWCCLFKSVYDGMQYKEKLTTYNWKGINVNKTFPAILKSYNTNRNVKSLSPDAENKDSRRTERIDRRELHSTMILRAFFHDHQMEMFSSPEIVECGNVIKRHILSIMQKSFSCKFQTLNTVKKANSIMQFIFLMHLFSDEFLNILEEQLQFSFQTNFEHVASEMLKKKYNVLNSCYITQITCQQYNILFKNKFVKRKLLSVLALPLENLKVDLDFNTISSVILGLCGCIIESLISGIMSPKIRGITLNCFYYMYVNMEIYVTINHTNKTITIDDCIFEEPYKKELQQYT